jgi:hypothetical protein
VRERNNDPIREFRVATLGSNPAPARVALELLHGFMRWPVEFWVVLGRSKDGHMEYFAHWINADAIGTWSLTGTEPAQVKASVRPVSSLQEVELGAYVYDGGLGECRAMRSAILRFSVGDPIEIDVRQWSGGSERLEEFIDRALDAVGMRRQTRHRKDVLSTPAMNTIMPIHHRQPNLVRVLADSKVHCRAPAGNVRLPDRVVGQIRGSGGPDVLVWSAEPSERLGWRTEVLFCELLVAGIVCWASAVTTFARCWATLVLEPAPVPRPPGVLMVDNRGPWGSAPRPEAKSPDVGRSSLLGWPDLLTESISSIAAVNLAGTAFSRHSRTHLYTFGFGGGPHQDAPPVDSLPAFVAASGVGVRYHRNVVIVHNGLG